MSPPGRPKGEYRSAQREGRPVSPPGRPKGGYRSAQREGRPVSPPGRHAAASAQRGIALIAVLWLTVLLTVIASSLAYSMRGEALSARNALSLAQARAAVDGAIERTAFELSRPRGNPEAWSPDGAWRTWTEGDIRFRVTAVDETARIDLNVSNDALLKGLLANVGGADADTVQRVFDAISDWRDPDDLKRPNGAEAADYQGAGRKYKPANGPFESIGELRRVLGMTPELYAKIADSLTVYSRQQGINAATAPRDVLLAVPTATPEAVDAFLQQRAQALQDKQAPPTFAPAAAYFGRSPGVWRVHAEATMPDGVTFVRDAVLRPSGEVRRPFVNLLWQEGATGAAAVAAPANPGATPNEPGNR
jgi:general secretion pathway protein K